MSVANPAPAGSLYPNLLAGEELYPEFLTDRDPSSSIEWDRLRPVIDDAL